MVKFCCFLECPRLRSSSYSRLAALNVVVATHQEAYLYNFPVENGETVCTLSSNSYLAMFLQVIVVKVVENKQC